MHLNVLRVEEQFKPQSNKWQEMRNIREEINKMVTKIAYIESVKQRRVVSKKK